MKKIAVLFTTFLFLNPVLYAIAPIDGGEVSGRVIDSVKFNEDVTWFKIN